MPTAVGSAVCCPDCGCATTKVTSTKFNEQQTLIRRYRKCIECQHCFRTTQPVEAHDDDGSLWGTKLLEGVKSPRAVFTAENVKELRETYATGLYSQAALADVYGCAQTTVCEIVTHKTYANIE